MPEDKQYCSRGGPTLLIDEWVGKSFLTAVLLTDSVKQAEMAVLEGIHSLSNGTDPDGNALLINAAAAGVRQRHRRTGAADMAKASFLLPPLVSLGPPCRSRQSSVSTLTTEAP